MKRLLTENSEILYKTISGFNKAVELMELCEFRYSIESLLSNSVLSGAVKIPECSIIEKRIKNPSFYKKVELKPAENGKIIIDSNISELTISLFAGIIKNRYNPEWINNFFYFDVRAFLFFPRTGYFTDKVLSHLQNTPYRSFSKKQDSFSSFQGVGYRDFRNANTESDRLLLGIIDSISEKKGFPLIIGIAGPTAAGKTEIAEYLKKSFSDKGKSIQSVEMDNFFTDREYREANGIGTMKKESLHYDLLIQCLSALKQGKSSLLPEYNQITASSSHDSSHRLKTGGKTLKAEPSDIIFLEGNFPFLFKEIIPLIDLKIIYLTDDPVRLKRKWKRDIDYRKKYDRNYFCNRYFKTQFLKAQEVYIKQLETCDIAADTTNASIWVTEAIEKLI